MQKHTFDSSTTGGFHTSKQVEGVYMLNLTKVDCSQLECTCPFFKHYQCVQHQVLRSGCQWTHNTLGYPNDFACHIGLGMLTRVI